MTCTYPNSPPHVRGLPHRREPAAEPGRGPRLLLHDRGDLPGADEVREEGERRQAERAGSGGAAGVRAADRDEVGPWDVAVPLPSVTLELY